MNSKNPNERILPDQAVFAQALFDWWNRNRRHFPWRNTTDPYRVLVAEILLHRTRAAQVVPLFEKLMREAPTIEALASISLRKLKALLTAGGLVWRVELLHETTKVLMERHAGRIPRERDELEALPGVGPYIAAAVRCFAFGENDVLQDTNTVRIVSRLDGLPLTDGARRSRIFREHLEQLQDPSRPKNMQLALLDLGSLICRSHAPLCRSCPVRKLCVVGRRVTELSAKPTVGVSRR